MSVLTWSLVANAVLAITLVVVVIRAKNQLVQEKLATFAGMLNAIIFGLAPADAEKRWDRLAFGLKGMLGEVNEDEIRWRLIRASFMRYFRTEPVAADLGEHIHALALQCVTGDADAERVWVYFDGLLAQEPGFEDEPQEHFTAAELARGQMQLEAELFRLYAATLARKPPALFS